MTSEVLTAIFSLAGTLVGSLGGILAAGRLTAYRLQQLEDKVNKHNNLIERVYALERHDEVQDVKIERLESEVESNEKKADEPQVVVINRGLCFGADYHFRR